MARPKKTSSEDKCSATNIGMEADLVPEHTDTFRRHPCGLHGRPPRPVFGEKVGNTSFETS